MEESTTYTVVTVAGEEVEIVSKYGEGDQIILVTAAGAKYVSAGQDNDWVEPYDPDKHLGGDSVGHEPNENTEGGMTNPLDGIDATAHANATAELEADAMGVDTTTADASAETAGEPDEMMGGSDGPLPPSVNADEAPAEEKPEEKPEGKSKDK